MSRFRTRTILRGAISAGLAIGRVALVATVGLVALGQTSRAASATDGDLLTGFNAITLNDFRSTADAEGPILVGGNLTGSASVMNYGAVLPSTLGGFGSLKVPGSTAGANSITANASFATPVNTMWQRLTTRSPTAPLPLAPARWMAWPMRRC